MIKKDKYVRNLDEEMKELKDLLPRLRQGAEAADLRAVALMNERKQHVLAALGEGDVAAKKQLQQLDGELGEIQRRQEDYKIALVEAQKQLDNLHAELALNKRIGLVVQFESAIAERLDLGAQLESEIFDSLLPKLKRIQDATKKLTVLGQELGIDRNFRSHSLGRALGFVIALLYLEFPLHQTILSGGELAYGFDLTALKKPKPLSTTDRDYFGRASAQARALVPGHSVRTAAE